MSDVDILPNPPAADKFKFTKCNDARGHAIRGLWERNGRFYAQMEIPGKGTRRVPLVDEANQPVESVAAAVKARNRLLMDRDVGRTPGPRVTPKVREYCLHYIGWLESTQAKSPLTIRKERGSLRGWVDFMGDLRLNQITRKGINAYVLQRTTEGEVSNRAANLDVMTLHNLLRFAATEGWVRGDLPTEGWKPLKYVAPRRSLLSQENLDKICEEAVSQVNGKPKYVNGQFLCDYVKLLAYSGARRQAGLSLRWEQVDWTNRQVTFFTKFDKAAVVDFNEKLEAHLKDMLGRKQESCPWVFPSPRSSDGPGFFANPQKTLGLVTSAIGLADFKLHDLRHFFISHAVMAGIDTLTIAAWVQHADGGVLIGKTYGHLNPQHKRDAAAKLQFQQEDEKPKVDLNKMTAAELLQMLSKTAAENAEYVKKLNSAQAIGFQEPSTR